MIDDLHESMWAKQYWGLLNSDPIIIELMKRAATNNEEVWNAGSYEPFQAIVARADKVRSFFETLEGTALVVSHGTFSKFFALRMLLTDTFSLPAWNSARSVLRISNTGLSVFEFRDGTWRILTWNDRAHLG